MEEGEYRTSIWKVHQVYDPKTSNPVEILGRNSNLGSCQKLIGINDDSDEHRISFLIKRYLGNIINFDDSPVLLINVDQILLEGRNVIQPPNITCMKRLKIC